MAKSYPRKDLERLKQAGFDVKGIVQLFTNSKNSSLDIAGNIVNVLDKLPINRVTEDYGDKPVKKIKVSKTFNTRTRIVNELKEVYCGKNNRSNIH